MDYVQRAFGDMDFTDRSSEYGPSRSSALNNPKKVKFQKTRILKSLGLGYVSERGYRVGKLGLGLGIRSR